MSTENSQIIKTGEEQKNIVKILVKYLMNINGNKPYLE
jgi:hypothetical protein